MKTCKKCKIEKPLEAFKNEKRNLDGKSGSCRECTAQHKRGYRKENLASFLEKEKLERQSERWKQYQKSFYKKNKNKLLLKAQENYRKNSDSIKQKVKTYRNNNEEKCRETVRNWHRKNRVKQNEYIKKRLKTDPQFRIKHSLRNRLRKLVKSKKETGIVPYLGCDIGTFISHLESQFNSYMNWTNYGSYWHIDHIIPCRAFDLTKEEEIKKCFHFSNLQPLTAKENCSKMDKMPDGTHARFMLCKSI